MRAGSLSIDKVIELLNRYFVPVLADGTYLEHCEAAPSEVKEAYRRVFQALHRANQERKKAGEPLLSVGTVHAYVLTPEGESFDALHVASCTPDAVIAMLQRAVEKLQPTAGKPVAEPRPLSAPPA